jgi:hypothetical protein
MGEEDTGRAAAIADRWERISRTPLWHAAGCCCAGGAGCLLVDLVSTEADLLDSLVNGTHLTDDPRAVALLHERRRALQSGAHASSFGEWIRRLPDSGLPHLSIDRLLSNIDRFVDSLKTPSGGRFTYREFG